MRALIRTFRRLSVILLGRPDFANLDQRLFNIMCFGGGIVGLISAAENAVIEASALLIVGSLIQSAVMLGSYALSRARGIYRPLVWPVLLAILSFLAWQWFLNAGSIGGAHYFFFVCGMMGAVILHRWQRYFFIFVYVIVLNVMVYVEYTNPALITGYASRDARYIDVAFSISVCMIVLGLVIAVFAGHYQELVRRLERHRLEFVEDLHLARLLQEAVFQHDESLTAGMDCQIVYRPSAALGGDLYDLSRRMGILRIFLADMKGHGVNAALSSMLMKSEWVHSGHASFTAGEALENLNRRIVQRYGESLVLSAVVADVYEDSLHYAAAGHVPQFLATGGALVQLEATGVPLGVMADSGYKTNRAPMPRGSRLVLFTDVFHDQPDPRGQAVGTAWMEETLRKPHATSADLVRSILAKFRAKSGVEPGDTADDLTLIVIGR